MKNIKKDCPQTCTIQGHTEDVQHQTPRQELRTEHSVLDGNMVQHETLHRLFCKV